MKNYKSQENHDSNVQSANLPLGLIMNGKNQLLITKNAIECLKMVPRQTRNLLFSFSGPWKLYFLARG